MLVAMRTTVDIPEPLHRIAASLAQHTGRSFSQTVVALMERGLQMPVAAAEAKAQAPEGMGPQIHPLTGLPVTRSRRVVTPADVADLEDEA
jgi:hypothetical protein